MCGIRTRSHLSSWAIAPCLAVLACVGCVTTKVDDLTLASIETVDLQNQPELPASFGPPHATLLKVSFRTTSDLARIDDVFTLSDEIFFCDRPDVHVRLGSPFVYQQGIKVPASAETLRVRNATAASSVPITYYTFLRASFDENPEGKPPFESFDLKRLPKDVCFRLVGGAYRAFGWRSNTIVIPKHTIALMLQHVGRDPEPIFPKKP